MSPAYHKDFKSVIEPADGTYVHGVVQYPELIWHVNPKAWADTAHFLRFSWLEFACSERGRTCKAASKR
ncbi:MAG: hypothetical protein D6820_17320 [Lentisphaerae bacterium]|nr:MAG: hypothetical protein D6820_17320 [Lentisphaerota bacterium]